MQAYVASNREISLHFHLRMTDWNELLKQTRNLCASVFFFFTDFTLMAIIAECYSEPHKWLPAVLSVMLLCF